MVATGAFGAPLPAPANTPASRQKASGTRRRRPRNAPLRRRRSRHLRPLVSSVEPTLIPPRSLSAWVRQRGEEGLDLGPEMLEIRRQGELLAEVLERLVGGEAGADRGDLEQHAARLAEVDRLEVEAVDDRRRPGAGACDPLLPRLVLVRQRRPRDVVHRPRTADTGLLGRLVVAVPPFSPVSSCLVTACCLG